MRPLNQSDVPSDLHRRQESRHEEPRIHRCWSRWLTLIGAAGVGLIASALFATDPVSGYPPRTWDALTQPIRTGFAHNLSALPVLLGLSGAALATARRSWRAGQHSFAGYSAGTGIGALTTLVLAGGFGQAPDWSRSRDCFSASASSPRSHG